MVSAIRVSSSVSNFKDKALKKLRLPEYCWKYLFKKTLFFGLYHPLDYLRFILHRGERKVMWCGSDILKLEKSIWRFLIRVIPAKHYCENGVEWNRLREMKIWPEILPLMLCNYSHGSWERDGKLKVYMCAHKGREAEYGVSDRLFLSRGMKDVEFHVFGAKGNNTDNVFFHGQVPHEKFVEMTSDMHCALRLNSFDGFSEVVALAFTRGHYVISAIRYPYAFDADDVKKSLDHVKLKTRPDIEAMSYWTNLLSKNVWKIKQ